MIIRTIAAFAALSVPALAPAAAQDKTFDIAGFDELDVSRGVEVKVEVGGDFAIEAEATRGDIERLIVEKKGSSLRVSRETRNGWNMGRSQDRFVVTVSMPALDGVDASSGSAVRATGVDSERVSVDISSGASVSLSGVCGLLIADLSSGSNLKAKSLECREIEVDASSGADADVFASERAEADASSGADIDIYGGPNELDSDQSSGGDVDLRS